MVHCYQVCRWVFEIDEVVWVSFLSFIKAAVTRPTAVASCQSRNLHVFQVSSPPYWRPAVSYTLSICLDTDTYRAVYVPMMRGQRGRDVAALAVRVSELPHVYEKGATRVMPQHTAVLPTWLYLTDVSGPRSLGQRPIETAKRLSTG